MFSPENVLFLFFSPLLRRNLDFYNSFFRLPVDCCFPHFRMIQELSHEGWGAFSPLPTWGQQQTHRLRSLVNESASQSLWYQLPLQVVLCASDRLAVNQRYPWHLLGFNYFARAAHRTQRNMLLPRLLVCYKGYERIWINSWMNRWTRRGPEHRSFWVGDLAIWKLSETPSFWVFMEVSSHMQDGRNHW